VSTPTERGGKVFHVLHGGVKVFHVLHGGGKVFHVLHGGDTQECPGGARGGLIQAVSQARIAFTVAADNEFEALMPHGSSAGSARSGP
jgi:hypothetical protein